MFFGDIFGTVFGNQEVMKAILRKPATATVQIVMIDGSMRVIEGVLKDTPFSFVHYDGGRIIVATERREHSFGSSSVAEVIVERNAIDG